MNSQKTVTVIGGGIAGLSASVFLTEQGFKVTLLEASPKLGGRAYSFLDKEKNQFFDNGQHILAGWYQNTFEYLKIIGSYDKLNFQKELEVNFINTDKEVFRLRCPDAEPPMNLIKGLLKFNALGFKDKFALRNINKLIEEENDFENKYINTRELLTGIKQTKNLIKYFWEPFILAVFNTRLENVNVKIFLNVLRIGFNEKKNSTLVIPDVNLNELLVDDAIKFFEKNDVNVFLNKRVDRISINENVEKLIAEDGSEIDSDFYISAVPFFAFKKLLDEKIYYENNFKSELLKSSGIVSVHLFTGEKIPEDIIPYNSFGMTGLIGTIVQWIFKRSDGHLSLVISGADELQITDMSNEDIYKLCLKDLMQTIEGFDKLIISGYKVIKEKRATFIPDFSSDKFRAMQNTNYKNFFIAGDWTDTGMPATIESAVTSAKKCCEAITNFK
ncbi:MAG: hydroxysqualene dehydroxylase HpnE [Bacteroidota bacterium]|nr:hydroxysqualene dehydroxylase HpnE [Bacteroidota bacterium]